MTFGLEFDFSRYSWSTYQTAMNAAMVVVGALLFGLFLRVQTGKTATWYAILERLIAVGFLGVATLSIFILPVTMEAIKIYAVWYGLQVLFMIILPGKVIYGLPLKDGKTKLKYNCNGLAAFILTWVLFFGGAYLRLFKLSILWDNFVPLLNVVNIWSFIMTAYLYIRGTFSKDRVSTGNPIEDWWYGLELNPRIGSFDLKFFSESRPGLILWVAINFSIAAAQYEKIGTVNIPMIFVCIFQFIYVFDYFILEEYIVSTIDIIHERFGWMLVWGDYVWVPFFYVQQAMYLYYFPRENSLAFNVICIVAFLFGYCVFRFSNRQKHKFKENPSGLIWGRPAKVIDTKRGSKLLISGWWGLARHINYLGDLLLAFSWGLPVGFESYIPYLYLAFMTGLLLHRFARDDKKCSEKYGEDWEKYCKAVPYKLIPYIW